MAYFRNNIRPGLVTVEISSVIDKHAQTETDRQTDRQTDGQQQGQCIPCDFYV